MLTFSVLCKHIHSLLADHTWWYMYIRNLSYAMISFGHLLLLVTDLYIDVHPHTHTHICMTHLYVEERLKKNWIVITEMCHDSFPCLYTHTHSRTHMHDLFICGGAPGKEISPWSLECAMTHFCICGCHWGASSGWVYDPSWGVYTNESCRLSCHTHKRVMSFMCVTWLNLLVWHNSL